MGQRRCHGWTRMNHIYLAFSFLFRSFFFSLNLKHNLTVRESVRTPLGSQLPKGEKD